MNRIRIFGLIAIVIWMIGSIAAARQINNVSEPVYTLVSAIFFLLIGIAEAIDMIHRKIDLAHKPSTPRLMVFTCTLHREAIIPEPNGVFRCSTCNAQLVTRQVSL